MYFEIKAFYVVVPIILIMSLRFKAVFEEKEMYLHDEERKLLMTFVYILYIIILINLNLYFFNIQSEKIEIFTMVILYAFIPSINTLYFRLIIGADK